MVAIQHTRLTGKARQDVEATIQRVSDLIRARYPEATFEVDCVEEDLIHLYTTTAEDHDRELMELADDEVDQLEDAHQIFLAVIPLVKLQG